MMVLIQYATMGLRKEEVLLMLFIGLIAYLLTSPRRADRRCRRCKEWNPPHARFCGQCGQPLKKR